MLRGLGKALGVASLCFLFPQSIDPGQQFTWDHSNLEVNKPKNRYANVIAYDHSRVILAPIEGWAELRTHWFFERKALHLKVPEWLNFVVAHRCVWLFIWEIYFSAKSKILPKNLIDLGCAFGRLPSIFMSLFLCFIVFICINQLAFFPSHAILSSACARTGNKSPIIPKQPKLNSNGIVHRHIHICECLWLRYRSCQAFGRNSGKSAEILL